MVDYGERIEEVCQLLQAEFGVTDRELIEAVLAIRLESEIDYPWLAVETGFYSLDMSRCWLALGEDDSLPIGHSQRVVSTLAEYRINRPRLANQHIKTELEKRERPRIFIEPQWEKPVTIHYKLVMWPYLNQNLLRIRSVYPAFGPIRPTAKAELKVAVERVLDNRWRRAYSKKRLKINSSLLYYAELMRKLNPGLRDWDEIINGLCALVRRRAILYNRDAQAEDWQICARVLSDSVPPWIAHLLKILELPKKYGQIKTKWTDAQYPEQLFKSEWRRLKETLIVWYDQGRYRLNDHDAYYLLAMVKGELELEAD